MLIPAWLPSFVREQMDRLASDKGPDATRLRPDGFMLFGTIGMEAVLKVDGTVWYYEDKGWPAEQERLEGRQVHDKEAWAAVSIAAEWLPRLNDLLPQRPPNAIVCPVCKGERVIRPSNSIGGRGFICDNCGRLGWVDGKT